MRTAVNCQMCDFLHLLQTVCTFTLSFVHCCFFCCSILPIRFTTTNTKFAPFRFSTAKIISFHLFDMVTVSGRITLWCWSLALCLYLSVCLTVRLFMIIYIYVWWSCIRTNYIDMYCCVYWHTWIYNSVVRVRNSRFMYQQRILWNW